MELGLSALQNLAKVAQQHRGGREQEERPIPKEPLLTPRNFDSSHMMHPVPNMPPHTLMQPNSVAHQNPNFASMANASLPPRALNDISRTTPNSALMNVLPNSQHPSMPTTSSYQPRPFHSLPVNPISQPQPAPTQTPVMTTHQNVPPPKEELKSTVCTYCNKYFISFFLFTSQKKKNYRTFASLL